jgi:flagellar hook protein FlgE
MSMRTSVTGLNAAQTELSTIANNLANASTSGFKASRVEFADIFAADASKVTPGAGVRVAGVTQMMKQGGLEFTGQNLDLAINGNGFFVMRDSNE